VTASVKVRIVVGPSRILVAALGPAHLGALSVTLVVVVPAWGKLLIAVALVASGASSICRSALQRDGSAIVELEVEEGSRVSCCTRDAQWREGQVLPSSFVSSWLTVLNLRLAGATRARHLVILPDNVEKEAFRRLRFLLRWSRPAPDGSAYRSKRNINSAVQAVHQDSILRSKAVGGPGLEAWFAGRRAAPG
jgi:membrane-bound toxin of toxin-antitoxin system